MATARQPSSDATRWTSCPWPHNRNQVSQDPGAVHFPDAVTARGTKHLGTLARLARSGTPAFLLFVCQRADVEAVTVAADIDQAYAAALADAVAAGVIVLACRCEINQYAINIDREIAFG